MEWDKIGERIGAMYDDAFMNQRGRPTPLEAHLGILSRNKWSPNVGSAEAVHRRYNVMVLCIMFDIICIYTKQLTEGVLGLNFARILSVHVRSTSVLPDRGGEGLAIAPYVRPRPRRNCTELRISPREIYYT